MNVEALLQEPDLTVSVMESIYNRDRNGLKSRANIAELVMQKTYYGNNRKLNSSKDVENDLKNVSNQLFNLLRFEDFLVSNKIISEKDYNILNKLFSTKNIIDGNNSFLWTYKRKPSRRDYAIAFNKPREDNALKDYEIERKLLTAEYGLEDLMIDRWSYVFVHKLYVLLFYRGDTSFGTFLHGLRDLWDDVRNTRLNDYTDDRISYLENVARDLFVQFSEVKERITGPEFPDGERMKFENRMESWKLFLQNYLYTKETSRANRGTDSYSVIGSNVKGIRRDARYKGFDTKSFSVEDMSATGSYDTQETGSFTGTDTYTDTDTQTETGTNTKKRTITFSDDTSFEQKVQIYEFIKACSKYEFRENLCSMRELFESVDYHNKNSMTQDFTHKNVGYRTDTKQFQLNVIYNAEEQTRLMPFVDKEIQWARQHFREMVIYLQNQETEYDSKVSLQELLRILEINDNSNSYQSALLIVFMILVEVTQKKKSISEFKDIITLLPEIIISSRKMEVFGNMCSR